MTLEECTELLTPLAIAMRVQMDVPTYRAYHAILKEVPAGVAAAAVSALTLEGMRFFPSASEILLASEKARRRQLAAHPWEGCVECEDQRGYRTLTLAAGQKTVQPCPCKARHQAMLESHGLLTPIALLEGEAGAGDERIYPTLEQLPAPLQKQIKQIAAGKSWR